MSPEHHLLWMTASMGGMVQEEKQTRTWGEGGSRQQMLAGETQCLEEVRAGWRVAGLEGGPPGALWRQARVGPPGSSGWAWQGTWLEKVSLAECHHPGVLLHPRPTFPAILGLTAPVAGWPSPGPQASAPSCPLLLPVVKPWAVLPQHPLLIHSPVIRELLGPTQGTGVTAVDRPVLAGRVSAHLPSMAPHYLQDGTNPHAHAQSHQPRLELSSLDSSTPRTPSPPVIRTGPCSVHGTHVHEPLQASARAGPSTRHTILSPLHRTHFHCFFRTAPLSIPRDASVKLKTPGVNSR